MSGKELKDLLRQMGYENVSELARIMGMGVQNLHKAFEVQDVKTGLIEDLANVLGVEVSAFYPSSNTAVTGEGIAVAGNGNNVTISEKVLDLMREKDKQIDRLLTIIETK